MVLQLNPAWAPSSVRSSNSARSSCSGTPHSWSWYASIAGSPLAQGQRSGVALLRDQRFKSSLVEDWRAQLLGLGQLRASVLAGEQVARVLRYRVAHGPAQILDALLDPGAAVALEPPGDDDRQSRQRPAQRDGVLGHVHARRHELVDQPQVFGLVEPGEHTLGDLGSDALDEQDVVETGGAHALHGAECARQQLGGLGPGVADSQPGPHARYTAVF